MKEYPIPVRNGETLGDYYDWSFELWQTIKEANADQKAERQFYDTQ